jgi:hypothetical protein
MESGTTGYSPECEVVEVIFARILTRTLSRREKERQGLATELRNDIAYQT